MTEKRLLEYFENQLTPAELVADLKNSAEHKGQITHYKIENLQSDDDFVVTPSHLLKLTDDVIDDKIKIEELTTISFALLGSDFFTWNADTDEGERVYNVLIDWDNPSIRYPLTIENLKLWKEYLISGEYRLG